MKTIVSFVIENTKKVCEVELSQETLEYCAKRFLALRLQSYYRHGEPIEFGTMEVCDKIVKFKEL